MSVCLVKCTVILILLIVILLHLTVILIQLTVILKTDTVFRPTFLNPIGASDKQFFRVLFKLQIFRILFTSSLLRTVLIVDGYSDSGQFTGILLLTVDSYFVTYSWRLFWQSFWPGCRLRCVLCTCTPPHHGGSHSTPRGSNIINCLPFWILNLNVSKRYKLMWNNEKFTIRY